MLAERIFFRNPETYRNDRLKKMFRFRNELSLFTRGDINFDYSVFWGIFGCVEIKVVAVVGNQVVRGVEVVNDRFPWQIAIVSDRNLALDFINVDWIFNTTTLVQSTDKVVTALAKLSSNEHIRVTIIWFCIIQRLVLW